MMQLLVHFPTTVFSSLHTFTFSASLALVGQLRMQFGEVELSCELLSSEQVPDARVRTLRLRCASPTRRPKYYSLTFYYSTNELLYSCLGHGPYVYTY